MNRFSSQLCSNSWEPFGGQLAWTTYVFTVIWLCLIGLFMSWIRQYEFAPGPQYNAPLRLPHDSLTTTSRSYTLIMFLHPHCACSRASLAELKKILARCRGLNAYVVFFAPGAKSSDWYKTDLWETARAMDGVTIKIDPDARLAVAYGSATSGQTLLYDDLGQLRFTGGITESRGHEGDNLGAAQIEMIAGGNGTSPSTPLGVSPVYGCQIYP